jgi:predicted alpha/beta-fold hydrolase
VSRTDPRLIDDGKELARAGLVHRVALPDGEGPFPTVLMLHGRAGNEDVMWIFAPAVPEGWLLVAPRGIVEDPYRARPLAHSWRVMDFVAALPELYNADLSRLYLMGFSPRSTSLTCRWAPSWISSPRFPSYTMPI